MGLTEKEARKMLDDIKKDKKERDFGSSDKKFYKLPSDTGKYRIRHLVHPKNKGLGKRVWTHFNVPHENIKVVTCYRTFGMDCPYCDLVEKYEKKYGIDTEKMESSLQTKYNVLVLNDDDVNPDEPVIMNMSGDYNLEWYLENCFEEDPETGEKTFIDLTDPKENYPILYHRKKDAGKLERVVAKKPSPISKDEDEVEEIMGKTYDLDKIWGEPDDDYNKIMKKACTALSRSVEERMVGLDPSNTDFDDDEEDEDDVEEIKKKKKKLDRKKKTTKRKKKVVEEDDEFEDEDDEVEDDDFEDEEEEEVKPKRRAKKKTTKKKTKKKVVEEDEDDDDFEDDEDDDEEEVKPKKKTKKKVTKKKVVEEEDEDDDEEDDDEATETPVGAPDCYGDSDVYSDKRKKCMICSFEWDCKKECE